MNQNRSKGQYVAPVGYDPNKYGQFLREIAKRLDSLESSSGQASSSGDTITITKTLIMTQPIDMGGQPIVNPDYATEEWVAIAIAAAIGGMGIGAGTADKIVKWTAANTIGNATNTDAEVSAAVTASHAKQHAITAAADHTSAATAGKMLKADANGLPVDATNTDIDVADAVSKKHTQSHLITSTSDHGITGLTASQLIRLNAGATALESSGKAITDFETAGAAAAHSALTTGVHGVGAGTVAKTADITATKLDDFTAPDDNTDLDASTSKHGLLLKATAPAAGLLSIVGVGNGETVYANKALFDTTNPEALGTAGPGTQIIAARRDHVHTLPKLDDMAATDDNTDLNASITKHGLCPKGDNDITHFLRGDLSWAVPAGGGGGDPGEGSIFFFPLFRDSIGAGTWAMYTAATVYNFGNFYNTSNANGDNLIFKRYLAAGTYTIKLLARASASEAKAEIKVDGVQVALFDCYAGGDDMNSIYTQTAVVIAASGVKTIVVGVNGRNALATAWYLFFQNLEFYRPA